MWSGPRNLSTALMRSFANRGDFEVIDEPFYAAYLRETDLKHPMHQEILKTQISDQDVIAKNCSHGPITKKYQYQKTLHLLYDFLRTQYLHFYLHLEDTNSHLATLFRVNLNDLLTTALKLAYLFPFSLFPSSPNVDI